MASDTINRGTDPSNRIKRERPNILLAVTGSVAGIKGPEIAVKLVKRLNANVRVLLTRGGSNFWEKANGYDELEWAEMLSFTGQDKKIEVGNNRLAEPPRISIIDSDDEWKGWTQLGDPVLHIELRDWADTMIIAPLSAHTLAKISLGLCDDTLTCVVRAWDFGHGSRPAKPLLLAPAMNTAMYDHPVTAPQLETIQKFWNREKNSDVPHGVVVISPQVKTLACGEVGIGALASVDQIVTSVEDALTSHYNFPSLDL